MLKRWIRLHRHDQTELNRLIRQEAPTFHIVSIEFFDVAGLHIQVPCVTSSFIMTAITQYTAPMQLMLESCYQCLWNHVHHTLFSIRQLRMYVCIRYQTTGHLQWFNSFVMLKTVVNICTYIRHTVDMLYCNDWSKLELAQYSICLCIHSVTQVFKWQESTEIYSECIFCN